MPLTRITEATENLPMQLNSDLIASAAELRRAWGRDRPEGVVRVLLSDGSACEWRRLGQDSGAQAAT